MNFGETQHQRSERRACLHFGKVLRCVRHYWRERLDQLEQNLAAVGLKLDADDLSVLDSLSRLAPEYPGWMHERTAPTRMPSGVQLKPSGLPFSGKSGNQICQKEAAMSEIIEQKIELPITGATCGLGDTSKRNMRELASEWRV